jgi:hypothetical protein
LLSTVWLDLFESDPATALRLGLHLEPKDTISIDLPEFENVAECVPYVIKAIAGAQIAPEDSNQLLNAMWSGSKLQKLDELEKQVEQLMEFKNGNN